jgi:hypothetical protein
MAVHVKHHDDGRMVKPLRTNKRATQDHRQRGC